MAITKLVLDRQAEGRVFPFGTTAAGGDALVTLNKGTAALSTVLLDVKASANIGGDLFVAGNFTFGGSINEQTTNNLLVNDINITLNRGGTTAGALNAGLFIEGDTAATIGKLLYDASLISKWKIGDGTTQVEIVTVSGAQTLTGKSISGAQITSAVALATTVTTNANLIGVITSVGNTTSIGSQTGTGNTFVMNTSPTLVTPILGVATSTSLASGTFQSVGTAGSVNGDMIWNNATNAFTQTFRGSNPGASIVYVLPTTAPTVGQVLQSSAPAAGIATMSWASVATGSVTSVSVTTANGVSGTVATATSTPAITLVLGAITPTSVAATGAITGSNLSGTNTGDQTSISGNAGSATTTGITDDIATATIVYPTWVTANTGNLPHKVSSTKLSFVPSTGALTGGSFIKSGGTAAQFLKADGSSDSSTYLTNAVTTVSVATANGISGTVATATSTPVITLTLGAITPTTINGNILTTGTGTLSLGTNTLTVTANASIAGTHTGTASGNNTGDQTITLTGDVTGTGTGSFTTTLAKYQRKATVTGTQDGTNKIFAIGAAFKVGSDQVYINGALLDAGATNDYVYDGATTITFQAGFTAPASTDKLTAFGVF